MTTTLRMTIADAFRIQSENLADWRGKLNPEAYLALIAATETANHQWASEGTADPYEVFRGDSMTCFVRNWHPAETPGEEGEFAHPFGIVDAFRIQAGNLAEWKARLNAEAYSALLAAVDAANCQWAATKTGHAYNVFRGNDVSGVVETWHPQPRA